MTAYYSGVKCLPQDSNGHVFSSRSEQTDALLLHALPAPHICTDAKHLHLINTLPTNPKLLTASHNKHLSLVISLSPFFGHRAPDEAGYLNISPFRWHHEAARLSCIENRTSKWAWQSQYSSFREKCLVWRRAAAINSSVQMHRLHILNGHICY